MHVHSTNARRSAPREVPVTLARGRQKFDQSLVIRSPHTRQNYACALRSFFAYLQSTGLDPEVAYASELAQSILEDYYIYLVGRGRQQRGALTYVHGVQSFLRFLLRHGYLTHERHAAMVGGLRDVVGLQQYGQRPIDTGLARVVVYALHKPIPPATRGTGSGEAQAHLVALRDRAVIATLFSTALRRFEVASLNRSDLVDGCAFVRGKGMRDRTVYFDREAQQAITAYLAARTDDDPALFIRHDDGAPTQPGASRRISAHSVGAIIKRTAAEIGLDVTAHQLRHLKARVLLNNGAQLAEVQDILGHGSIEVTRRVYAHYTTAHIQQAWQRYSRSAAELVGDERRIP